MTHGKNIAYTVRKLGYPSRSVLSNWICEDIKNHQFGILKGKNIVQYTLEKKNAALEAALRNESMSKILKKTQASSQSLYNWKRKYVSDSLNEQIKSQRRN